MLCSLINHDLTLGISISYSIAWANGNGQRQPASLRSRSTTHEENFQTLSSLDQSSPAHGRYNLKVWFGVYALAWTIVNHSGVISVPDLICLAHHAKPGKENGRGEKNQRQRDRGRPSMAQ
ncbi:hypothetical protein LZ554_004976 [Drepanopeziza brunnea f. sp. 'monogermtubi']|nr:hypothetical protein LZ554_004976 [Drepanopeziza brunnea f. sp. 'monogermtubi']